MGEERDREEKISLSVPIGVIVTGLLLGLTAIVAYVMLGRNGNEGGPRKGRKGAFRKVGLVTLVTLIENDAARKVLVGVLRAIARRA